MSSHDARTDSELLAAADNGDAAAFEAIYYRYRDWVVRVAWRLTRNEQDALDVLQQTFAYLLTKIPGLELTGRFTTFLYPVVRSLSVTMLRKRGRLVSDDGALSAAAADDDAPGESTREDLATALAGIPDTQREVLLMRFVDDMTLEEIAGALRIPLGTVKSRIHNALTALRNNPHVKRYLDP